MAPPPCHRTKNTAFTHPKTATPQAKRAATKICDHCPIKTQCATSALTAGTTIDGVTQPANDVIQAGVECYGDQATEIALSIIAGITIPEHENRKPSRHIIGDHCKGCGNKMVQWTRAEVPEGWSMHHARGWGTCCRSEYAREAKANPRRTGLRKPINRRNHIAPKRMAREVVIQHSLFSREEVLNA